jgi:flagellar M-ring protein FliF
VLALGTLLFLFFMRRHLRRREGEALEREPTWLREIQAPRSLAQIEQELPTRPLATPKPDPARLQVEEYAQREPERVAQQVRHWLKED